MNINKTAAKKVLYLVFIFFTSALLGGLIEILYQIILRGSFKLGGFLYGPIRPIYGWGALLLHIIGRKFNKNIFNIFISSLIICTLFEYVSSIILEMLFHHMWWDYSSFMFNINGRVCLIISLGWGMLAVIFNKLIEPLILKVYNKFDKNILSLILLFVFFVYKIDGTLSIINNFDKWTL